MMRCLIFENQWICKYSNLLPLFVSDSAGLEDVILAKSGLDGILKIESDQVV